MKTSLLVLLLAFCLSGPGFAQIDSYDVLKRDVNFQIYLYEEVTSYLDQIFQQFNDGYLIPGEALIKVNTLKLEYEKKAFPLPDETRNLYTLTRQLLSRVENYFIYYKKVHRESPEINMQIIKTRFSLEQEAETLRVQYF